jgi:hypothetical protein
MGEEEKRESEGDSASSKARSSTTPPEDPTVPCVAEQKPVLVAPPMQNGMGNTTPRPPSQASSSNPESAEPETFKSPDHMISRVQGKSNGVDGEWIAEPCENGGWYYYHSETRATVWKLPLDVLKEMREREKVGLGKGVWGSV